MQGWSAQGGLVQGGSVEGLGEGDSAKDVFPKGWYPKTGGTVAELLKELAPWRAEAPVPDLTLGGRDGEAVRFDHTREELSKQGLEPMTPFVYVTESVPYDILPHWREAAAKNCCMCAPYRGMGPCSQGDAKIERTCCRAQCYECSFGCSCAAAPETCGNRPVQAGVQKRLAVFWAGNRGWGVKSDEAIAKGEFVVEYVGELISHEEAQRRGSNMAYQFDCGLGKSGHGPYIDAEHVRNVSAFINFSCTPNLQPCKVESVHGDRSLPRVAFFAKEDIAPGEELGYRRDSEAITLRQKASSGMRCFCGTELCMGWC